MGRFLWALLLAGPAFGASATPAIAPVSLSFICQVGTSPFPQAVMIAVNQTGTFTATSNQSWLLLPNGTNSATGSLPTSTPFQIGINAAGLGASAAPYTGAVTFHLPQGVYVLPVTLQVRSGLVLEAYPGFVELGNTILLPPSGSVQVVVSNGQSAVVMATTTAPWMGAAVPQPGYVSIGASAKQATAGLNYGPVQITGTAQGGALPVNVPVFYLIGGPATGGPLTLNPNSLALSAGPAAISQTVAITGPAFTAAATVQTGSTNWLGVTQSSQGIAITANPACLAPGTYQGTVTLTAGGVVELLPVTFAVSAVPAAVTAVSNAASYAGGGISPGEVVTIFGSNIGPISLTNLQLDQNNLVSSTLAGVQVLFNGKAAPMIYAVSCQLAVVAPYELDGQSSAAVQVVFNNQTVGVQNVSVVPAAPGVFTADASGSGPGAILNANLSVNSPSNPAAPGDTVAVYATGEGQTNPPGVDGQVTQSTPPAPRLPVTATVDGQPANVSFAGEAPDIVSGVMQVNVTIPANARRADLPLVILVGGTPSQSGVTVSVR